MISVMKEWLLGVIAAAVCLSILDAMVPKGAMKGIAKVTGGLAMFLVLLRPWTYLDVRDWDWRYQEYQQQIDGQIDLYRQDYLQQMESIIERETGAYISEKAEQMGIACRVDVETEVENGVPVPASVRIDSQKNNVLADWIETELGISQTKQYWEGER